MRSRENWRKPPDERMMSLKKLVILPDQRLRQISMPILEIDKEMRTLAEDMFETMYHAPGIGLAAIQVGVPKRLFTLDVAKREDHREPMVVINPEITWTSSETNIYEEGCLSIPEYYEEIERPARIRLKYRDLEWKEKEIEVDGVLATCIQHEIDHLNGVLFIDYLSKLKRDRVITKFTKAAKREKEA
jgi:peptide deformylase